MEWAAHLDDLEIAHGGVVDAGYGSGLSFRVPTTSRSSSFPLCGRELLGADEYFLDPDEPPVAISRLVTSWEPESERTPPDTRHDENAKKLDPSEEDLVRAASLTILLLETLHSLLLGSRHTRLEASADQSRALNRRRLDGGQPES